MRYVIAVCCALAVIAAQALYGGAMRTRFCPSCPASRGGCRDCSGLWRFCGETSRLPRRVALRRLRHFPLILWREANSPRSMACGDLFPPHARVFDSLSDLCLCVDESVSSPGISLCAAARSMSFRRRRRHGNLRVRRPDLFCRGFPEQLRIWYAPRWNFARARNLSQRQPLLCGF